MGAKTETVGGGGAVPVANELSSQMLGWLQNGFQMPQMPGIGGQQTAGDNFGRANPFGSTLHIGDLIGQYLQGSDKGTTASAQAFQRQSGIDQRNIQQQFALGGTGFGTPASTGVANYMAQATPAFAIGQGKQQQDMLSQLLQMYGNMSQMGTPQAQTIQKPGLFGNIMSGLGGLAGAAAPFFAPGAVFGKDIFRNAAGGATG